MWERPHGKHSFILKSYFKQYLYSFSVITLVKHNGKIDEELSTSVLTGCSYPSLKFNILEI